MVKFFVDGIGKWIKFYFGKGGVDGVVFGLESDVEVYLELWVVVKFLGVMLMDRLEDMGVDLNIDCFYVMLINNSKLMVEFVNFVNLRECNFWGYILEIFLLGEDGECDYISDEFEWDIFFFVGDLCYF